MTTEEIIPIDLLRSVAEQVGSVSGRVDTVAEQVDTVLEMMKKFKLHNERVFPKWAAFVAIGSGVLHIGQLAALVYVLSHLHLI